MRVLIVHSKDAGAAELSGGELEALVAEAGHAPVLVGSKSAWHAAVRDADLVVAAGGDGTVARVVLALAAARLPVPFTVLPLGTANNVARALTLVAPPAALVAGWATAATRPFDVGVLETPWGVHRFIEAAGVGAFARALAAADDDELRPPRVRATPAAALDESVVQGLRLLRRYSRRLVARRWRLALDETDVEGRWLLAEVLNMPMIGPHLPLAPDADPGDGDLDVALLPERARDAFVAYLDARLANREAVLPVERHCAREVRLWWDGAPAHLDDDPWLPEEGERGPPARPTRAHPVELVLRAERGATLLAPSV